VELLVLALVALALCLTFCVVFLKLLWLGAKLTLGVLVLPFKLLGLLLGGAAELVLLPFALALVILLVVAALVALVVIPLALPFLLLVGVIFLGARLAAAA